MIEDAWPTSALDAAERAFQMLTARPSPLALDCRGLHEQLPNRHVPLDDLRRLLLARETGYEARAVAWTHLVHHAQFGGPEWTIGAVAMARPALLAVAGRLARGWHGDPADLDSAVLEGFLAALRAADPATERLPVPLIRAAQRVGKRARHSEIQYQRIARPLDPGALLPPPLYGHEDIILGRAVAAGVLTGDQAELIASTRLDKVSTATAARLRGVPEDALRMRRRRAEAKLVQALRDGNLASAVL
jgi:hypothetical protein